jgi:hypothetical protein
MEKRTGVVVTSHHLPRNPEHPVLRYVWSHPVRHGVLDGVFAGDAGMTPTSEGWYWLRHKAGDRMGPVFYQEDTDEPVQVYIGTEDVLHVRIPGGSDDDDPPIDSIQGEWLGRIPATP